MDPHELKAILLSKPGKQNSTRQSDPRNLSELEEPPEAPGNEGVLTYIKKLATYVSDLAVTLLGFARDAEAPDLVLGKKIDRIRIQTEAAYERMG